MDPVNSSEIKQTDPQPTSAFNVMLDLEVTGSVNQGHRVCCMCDAYVLQGMFVRQHGGRVFGCPGLNACWPLVG